MKSISGIRMRSPSITVEDYLESSLYFLSLPMCFSPFLYFLSQNISREKRKLKEVMKTMGLHDVAFWLSWGLLYGGLLLIMSCVMALILQTTCPKSCFSALFLLFCLYGTSSVSSLVFVLGFLKLNFNELYSLLKLMKG
uniref:ABC-2 type transporter transmembrane domain-containing protein n=1 Tax=Salvator merianae TaxID=96440 RepID=A0A8D0CCJ8_SALMN